MALPYVNYHTSSYTPGIDDLQRGAVIWPTNTSLPSTIPHSAAIDGEYVLDQSSPRQAPSRSVTPSHRSVTPSHRSVTPINTSVTPVNGSVTPINRSVTPNNRSVTPSQILMEGVTPKETYIGDVSPRASISSEGSVDRAKLSDSENDNWESVLQESGMVSFIGKYVACTFKSRSSILFYEYFF